MNPSLWFRDAGWSLVFGLVMLMVATNASAEWKEKVLHSFQGGNDGLTPAGGVVFDKAGNLYGVTSEGGSTCPSPGCGTIFQLAPPTQKGGAWTESILYDFNGTDGSIPVGGAIIDADGNLYGTTAYGGSGTCLLFGDNVGCGVVYELSPPTKKGGQWTYNVLYNFQGGKDALFPWGNLVFDNSGSLYGATQFGGGKGTTCNPYFDGNCGTIFKLSPSKQKGGSWTEKILHSFAGGADGATPNGGLVLDGKGAIYGTTSGGGSEKGECGPGGCGTVFELKPPSTKSGTWAETVLYRFHGQDGATPAAGVVFGANGDLFGTASFGATGGSGAVFELATPEGGSGPWKETVLHRFKDGEDGANPNTSVLFDASGNLCGTAYRGSGGSLYGDVFRLTPPARIKGDWVFSVLHGFTGPPDGAAPAGLLFDRTGYLYSMTQAGGSGTECQRGCGTVFEVSP
jgi:uncharacterized repeat protein (TIGR03803 family)